ncbi:MAG: hypothetical protein ABFS35_12360 [Bacteroidota bacterium]
MMIISVYKEKHKFLTFMIAGGAGLVSLVVGGFEMEIQYLFLTGSVFLIAIILVFYDLIYQKQIEVNQIDKYIEVYYPIIKKRIKLTFDEIIKVEVIKKKSRGRWRI